MSDKATPRPWTYGHLANDDHPCDCKYIFADDGRCGAVGAVYLEEDGRAYPGRDEAAANLRLIVRCVNAHDDLVRSLQDCIQDLERNTCAHEETYRGGAIWEICSSCGAKWADDEGGKPDSVELASITAARALLDRLRKGAQ